MILDSNYRAIIVESNGVSLVCMYRIQYELILIIYLEILLLRLSSH